MKQDPLRWPGNISDKDGAWLQNEIAEAHKTIRALLRQISKEQARCNEISRAYNMTVSNLVEITRENASLTRERDIWKARADGVPITFKAGMGLPDLTAAEVGAIRKAMARLHHPDAGGDTERMKMWNAMLDPIERKAQ